MAAQEIVDALLAGAAAGGKETATVAIKDTYAALKNLVTRRFADRHDAQDALARVEAQAAAAGDEAAVNPRWRTLLDGELDDAGADTDPDILDAATRLLALLDEAGLRASASVSADRNVVDARHSQGTIIGGHHGTINQTFGNR